MRPSWEEFVTRYAKGVLDAALRVLGNADDADEVAQEVFLEIYQSKRLGDFVDQPALLRTISTRRAIDRLRRRKSTKPLSDCEPNCREADPSQVAIASELEDQLRRAIVDLPPREAEVFCLSVLEGISADEIAQLLNISKGAVAKALSSARGRLSTAFQEKQQKAGS